MKNKLSFMSRFINAMGTLFSLHQNRSSGKCVGFMILVFSLDISHLFFPGQAHY